MMQLSNLLILLLLNLAFAATLDNVPEEETNRVRHRGPSSSDASEKRTQFMEECGEDAACLRGKMRDWRRARQLGEPSLDRVRHRRPSSNGEALKKRSQFADECGGDLACVRGKMRDWRKSGKPSLDRRVHRSIPSLNGEALEKRTQFME